MTPVFEKKNAVKTVMFCQLKDGAHFQKAGDRTSVWKKESGLKRMNATLVDSMFATRPINFFSATTRVIPCSIHTGG